MRPWFWARSRGWSSGLPRFGPWFWARSWGWGSGLVRSVFPFVGCRPPAPVDPGKSSKFGAFRDPGHFLSWTLGHLSSKIWKICLIEKNWLIHSVAIQCAFEIIHSTILRNFSPIGISFRVSRDSAPTSRPGPPDAESLGLRKYNVFQTELIQICTRTRNEKWRTTGRILYRMKNTERKKNFFPPISQIHYWQMHL